MKINNLPNILTLIRIGAIPFFVIVFYLPFWWGHLVAMILFVLAALTDWFDGYLARTLKLTTKLGAFLDPVADKLIVSIALVLIVGEPQFQFISLPNVVYALPVPLISIPAAIIVSREIVVSALREWMAEIGKQRSVAVSYLGQVKTTIQMIALSILLFCDASSNVYLVIIGYILLYTAAVLTIWSMIIYLKIAWPELKE